MIVYHATTPENIPLVLKSGLKVGISSGGFTKAGEWADAYYPQRPIYVSLTQNRYPGVQIAINADSIELFPDLPSLVDTGAYITDDGVSLYWDENNEPAALQPYLEEGEIPIQELLTDPVIAEIAIRLTGTAVIYQDVPPDRITVLQERNSNVSGN